MESSIINISKDGRVHWAYFGSVSCIINSGDGQKETAETPRAPEAEQQAEGEEQEKGIL